MLKPEMEMSCIFCLEQAMRETKRKRYLRANIMRNVCTCAQIPMVGEGDQKKEKLLWGIKGKKRYGRVGGPKERKAMVG